MSGDLDVSTLARLAERWASDVTDASVAIVRAINTAIAGVDWVALGVAMGNIASALTTIDRYQVRLRAASCDDAEFARLYAKQRAAIRRRRRG